VSYKTIPDEVRKYAMGYYGKLAAQPSEVFLERADIRPEEVVQERPAAAVPRLPRLRAALGAAATDEDILLAAFYHQKLIEPLKKPTPQYQFRTTPLFELIRYLGSQADLDYARIRFAGTE
jgi:pyruvate/oxaloacetate carboxyltransferase